MFKKFLKTLVVLAVVGIVVYKAYEYFTRDDKYEELEDDFDDAAEEESLADKLKSAAKKVVAR